MINRSLKGLAHFGARAFATAAETASTAHHGHHGGIHALPHLL